MPRFRRVDAEGITFLFAYDNDAPDLLHIYARHLTTVDDALRVWFDSSAEEIWNERYRRFEVRDEMHLLLWCWMEGYEGQRVLIISCMRRED